MNLRQIQGRERNYLLSLKTPFSWDPNAMGCHGRCLWWVSLKSASSVHHVFFLTGLTCSASLDRLHYIPSMCLSVFWGDCLISLAESSCSLNGFQALAVTWKGFNFARVFSWCLLQGTAACSRCLCVLLGSATEILFCPGWPPPHNEKLQTYLEGADIWSQCPSAAPGPPGCPARSKSMAADTLQQNLRQAHQKQCPGGTGSLVWAGMGAWASGRRLEGQAGPTGAPRPGTHRYQVGHNGPCGEGRGGHCSYHFILQLSSAFWHVRKLLFSNFYADELECYEHLWSAINTSGLGLITLPASGAASVSHNRAEKYFPYRKNMTWYLLDKTFTRNGKSEIQN